MLGELVMLHTITSDNRDDHSEILEAMFKLRHDVVINQWKWDIPNIISGRESDQFDKSDTVHFVLMGEEGTNLENTALVCARLNPTTKPHMMDTLFPEYCNLQPSPAGQSVMEYSRYVSDNTLFQDMDAAKRGRLTINLAMIDFCLKNDVDRIVWLTHQLMYGLSLIHI